MPNAVKLKRLRGCNLSHIFTVDKVEKDGVLMVEKIYCMICQKHLDKIRRDPNIKGVAEKDAVKYTEGTDLVTK